MESFLLLCFALYLIITLISGLSFFIMGLIMWLSKNMKG